MADSNATKRALAAALKELMQEIPFEKINVAQICEKCGMNRKSFYYHFRDKYDLVNWIYDTEFFAVAVRQSYRTVWDFLLELLNYLYANRRFYRKALLISGQNSFSEHFREVMLPLIDHRLRQIMTCQEVTEFHINFFADAFVCAIIRWIVDRNCQRPEVILGLLRSCVEHMAVTVCSEMETT